MYTVLKGEKVPNSYTFVLITFFVGIYLQLFQRIRNQHRILRFMTPVSRFVEKIIFAVTLALFANFEAELAITFVSHCTHWREMSRNLNIFFVFHLSS